MIPARYAPPPPIVYTLPREAYDVFAVPHREAVGTLDMDEAFTVIHLDDDRVRLERLKGNYFSCVASGTMRFLPPVDERTVGYTQTRRFVSFDTVTAEATRYSICPAVEEHIERVSIWHGPSRTFLFEVMRSDGSPRQLRLMRLARLRGSTVELVAEKELGRYRLGYREPYCVCGQTILAYSSGERSITASGPALTPVEHPLCRLFADKGGKLRLVTELLLHPALPMAILVEREPVGSHACRCWVARWDCDNPRIVPLPVPRQENSRLSHLAYSPDGSWLVYRDNTEDRFDPVFMAVPVVPDAPLCLGAPVELGRCLGDSPVSTCWIGDPLSFVVCDGAALCRWGLDLLRR